MYERSIFIIVTALLASGCTVAQEVPIVDDNIAMAERASLQELFPVEEARPPEPFEPWSETFARESLGIALIEQTENYFNNNSVENCQWEPKAYSQEPLEDLDNLQLVMDQTSIIFCDLLEDDPIVIVSQYHYVDDVLEDLNRPTDDHGGICGSPGSGGSTGCALYHSSWISDSLTGESRLAITAHEMFHNVQDVVNKGLPVWRIPPGHALAIPMWFFEGTAVTYQYALMDYLGLAEKRYYEHDFSSRMLRPYPDTAIDLSSVETGWGMDVYVVGHFATEYLVANVGLQPMLNIVEEVGNETPFYKAFEQEIGMSLSDFYSKMERVQLLEN